MDFKEEIVQFMTDKVGGITIVAEGSAEIVYADSYFRKKYGDAVVGMDAEEIFVFIQPDGDLAGPGRCGNGCAGGLRRRLDAVAGGLCRPACLPPVIPHGTQRRKAQRQQDRQHNDQPLHRAASNGLPHL